MATKKAPAAEKPAPQPEPVPPTPAPAPAPAPAKPKTKTVSEAEKTAMRVLAHSQGVDQTRDLGDGTTLTIHQDGTESIA